MRFTSNWVDKGPLTVAAAARHGMCMVAVAALALGWATTATAGLITTGQVTCYKLERYPEGHALAGEVVVRDAENDAEFLDSGAPNPAFDSNTGVIQDNPTPCAGAGQDGEFQIGDKLLYVDRGDGRIFDYNSKLEWEKKSDDGSIHDKDNTYTWEGAFAYVKTLNNTCQKDATIPCSTDSDCKEYKVNGGTLGGACGFAGKRNWRLPNVKELQSLVNNKVLSPGPAVHEVFNTNCAPDDHPTVLTGSCTHADDLDPLQFVNDPSLLGDSREEHFTRVPRGEGIPVGAYYWASTTGDAPGDAWFVSFHGGDTGAHFKDVAIRVVADPDEPTGFKTNFAGHVRAVRGPK